MWLLQCCGGVCWFITISGLNMLNRVLNSCSRRNMLNRLLQCYKVFASLLPTLGGTGLLQCCVCCVQCCVCWMDNAEQGNYSIVCVVCRLSPAVSRTCWMWLLQCCVQVYFQQQTEQGCYKVCVSLFITTVAGTCWTELLQWCVQVYHQQWVEHVEQGCYK